MALGKLVVVGQGYVGLSVAIRGAEAGWSVTGYDTDRRRVEGLSEGLSPTPDVTSRRLKASLATGRYLPTALIENCRGFDYAVIAVPTPLHNQKPDLSFIELAARALGKFITVNCTVILESTTRPGTTEEILVPRLEAESGLLAGTDFFVGYSPERVDPGNTVWRFENIPKIVSGINLASLDRIDSFYRTLVARTVRVSGTREAELAKLLENTFRQVNIALVNELAVLSRGLRIDFWEVIEAAATKPFGFMRFSPGPGVGGHCIPIDPSYLIEYVREAVGESCRFAELANEINRKMPEYIVRRCAEILNSAGLALKGSRILLLGLAYKSDVGDIRESPAVCVAELLVELGAILTVCEPLLTSNIGIENTAVVEFGASALQNTDLVVVLANHTAFEPEAIAQFSKRVLDTRGCLPRAGNIEPL